MKLQTSLVVPVKKRIEDYEVLLDPTYRSKEKAKAGPCSRTKAAGRLPPRGASVPRKPQTSNFPVTEAIGRAKTFTTFVTHQRGRQGADQLAQADDLTGDDDDDDDCSVLGHLVFLVFIIGPVLIAANRTINTTVNVLPMTLNLASPGLVVGAIFLVAMVVEHFKPRVSVVHRGTQTESLKHPLQETGYPVQCTHPAKGDSHDDSDSEKDIRTQVILAIQKVTEV